MTRADFWNWAVKAYGGSGIAALCLDLQDGHDQCVPLLLWAIWCAVEGRSLDADIAAESADMARSWSDNLIQPLRNLRQRLKSPISDMDDARRLPLREGVKGLELQAEKQLMVSLAQLDVQGQSLRKASPDQAALDNLVAVGRAWSAKVPRSAFADLVQALSESDFLRYTGE